MLRCAGDDGSGSISAAAPRGHGGGTYLALLRPRFRRNPGPSRIDRLKRKPTAPPRSEYLYIAQLERWFNGSCHNGRKNLGASPSKTSAARPPAGSAAPGTAKGGHGGEVGSESMADAEWGHLFVAALGGGLTVKLLDIAYQEYTRRKSQSRSAEQFVDQHLDPLLKSADELVGKLRALAERDFKPIHRVIPDDKCLSNHDFGSLVFLFGRFWAQVEIIRQEGMSVAMAKDERGLRLQNFFDCLESRRVRIIERILQRAAGEAFLSGKETRTYVDFAHAFENDVATRRWIMPLAQFLSRTEHTRERQQLLQYGAIAHALIDTLDPTHLVTRERPSMPNKLSHKSWTDLNYRVFSVYLKFVKDRKKYIGPPRRRPY
jgi:hypothetical protein